MIAINDITEAFAKAVKYALFAYYRIFFITGKNLSTSYKILLASLDELQNYALQIGFKFSKSKTIVTIFSNAKTIQSHYPQIHLH